MSSSEREFGSVKLREAIAEPNDLVDVVKVVDELNTSQPVERDTVQLKKPMIGRDFHAGHFFTRKPDRWEDLNDSLAPDQESSAVGEVEVYPSTDGSTVSINAIWTDCVSTKPDEMSHVELVLVKTEASAIVAITNISSTISLGDGHHELQTLIPFSYEYVSDVNVKFAVKTTYRNGASSYDFITKSL